MLLAPLFTSLCIAATAPGLDQCGAAPRDAENRAAGAPLPAGAATHSSVSPPSVGRASEQGPSAARACNVTAVGCSGWKLCPQLVFRGHEKCAVCR
jgi:hypothetical protein